VGRKPVLLAALFLFSILSWMTGLAHNFHELLMIRALMGVAEGPTWSMMTALIEESSHPSRRGQNIGLVVSAAALVGLGGGSGVNHPSRGALGLAAGFLCGRRARCANGFSDLDVRARACDGRRDVTSEAFVARLSFHPALSQHLVMLPGSDRVHVLVARIEHIRAASHH
jgi:MFS family permease